MWCVSFSCDRDTPVPRWALKEETEGENMFGVARGAEPSRKNSSLGTAGRLELGPLHSHANLLVLSPGLFILTPTSWSRARASLFSCQPVGLELGPLYSLGTAGRLELGPLYSHANLLV